MRKPKHDEVVLTIYEANPYMTVREIAEEVYRQTGDQISQSTVKYALERKGIVCVEGKSRLWRKVEQ